MVAGSWRQPALPNGPVAPPTYALIQGDCTVFFLGLSLVCLSVNARPYYPLSPAPRSPAAKEPPSMTPPRAHPPAAGSTRRRNPAWTLPEGSRSPFPVGGS